MNILIIGGSGQDSFYLSSSLLNRACVVTCAHRSIHLYPPPSSRSIKYYRVKEYSFECLKSLFLSEEFDAVVVIAGPVGNRLATQDPIGCYLQSTKIVLAVFDLVSQFSRKAHIYYFSTVDIDGRASRESPFMFDSASVDILPRTTYGLSRLHGGQLLQVLCEQHSIDFTIIFLGMHESMLRTGSYVLSKIKNIIFNKQRGVIPSPEGFGNLNIHLDIGFAADYMELVASLIMMELDINFVTIGTGTYTSLLHLCEATLLEFGLDPGEYIATHQSSSDPSYFPLAPCSLFGLPECAELARKFLPNSHLPSLTAKMLKSEYLKLWPLE